MRLLNVNFQSSGINLLYIGSYSGHNGLEILGMKTFYTSIHHILNLIPEKLLVSLNSCQCLSSRFCSGLGNLLRLFHTGKCVYESLPLDFTETVMVSFVFSLKTGCVICSGRCCSAQRQIDLLGSALRGMVFFLRLLSL